MKDSSSSGFPRRSHAQGSPALSAVSSPASQSAGESGDDWAQVVRLTALVLDQVKQQLGGERGQQCVREE